MFFERWMIVFQRVLLHIVRTVNRLIPSKLPPHPLYCKIIPHVFKGWRSLLSHKSKFKMATENPLWQKSAHLCVQGNLLLNVHKFAVCVPLPGKWSWKWQKGRGVLAWPLLYILNLPKKGGCACSGFHGNWAAVPLTVPLQTLHCLCVF